MIVYILIESWPHSKTDAYAFRTKKEAEEFQRDSERHFPENTYKITSGAL